MYDRKKITLFVLLIATVLLGGVSLFLATQINQNQSPDDSQAGEGICSPRNTGIDPACSSKGEQDCLSASISIDYSNCCSKVFQAGVGDVCTEKTGGPAYCSRVSCEATNTDDNCAGPLRIDSVCKWTAATVNSCKIPGNSASVLVGETACLNGTNYTCAQAGSNATVSGCCNGYTSQGGICVPPSNSSCTQSGQTIAHNQTSCINNINYRCNNGAVTNLGSCTTGGGTASCTQSGEEISHGNTACINGTNYTCNNGTATPGGSCSTDPVTPPTQPGGSTGSTCTPTAPVKAKLTGPGNGAVINSNTVTLTWDRNGSWGVGCPENINQFRVRVAVVGVSDACPTDTSLGSYSRVGVVEGGPTGAFNLTVEDDKKYCWLIRKNNSDVSTDSGVRSFTVNIEEEEIDPGVDEDLTPGGEEIIDEEIVPITQASGGVPTGSGTALPDTAIVSDELDPILIGMLLVIIGLTLYKFDFGKKREVE
jgi:hypothetical protein